jgi:hypothetical protein
VRMKARVRNQRNYEWTPINTTDLLETPLNELDSLYKETVGGVYSVT